MNSVVPQIFWRWLWLVLKEQRLTGSDLYGSEQVQVTDGQKHSDTRQARHGRFKHAEGDGGTGEQLRHAGGTWGRASVLKQEESWWLFKIKQKTNRDKQSMTGLRQDKPHHGVKHPSCGLQQLHLWWSFSIKPQCEWEEEKKKLGRKSLRVCVCH